MAMTVLELASKVPDYYYNRSEFRNIIEDHLQILKIKGRKIPLQVTPFQETKYRGDFYGLLHSINIPIELHWITMRINGLHSPMDYQGNIIELIGPDAVYINLLLQRYMNSRKYL